MQTPLKSILITENPWIDGSFCFPTHSQLYFFSTSSFSFNSCRILSQCEPTIPKNKNKQTKKCSLSLSHNTESSFLTQKKHIYYLYHVYLYRFVFFFCIALYVPENGFFSYAVLCCVPYKYILLLRSRQGVS